MAHARLATARGRGDEHGARGRLVAGFVPQGFQNIDLAVASEAGDGHAHQGARGFADSLFEEQACGAVGKRLDLEAGLQQTGCETVDVDGAGRGSGEQVAGLIDDVAQRKLARHVGAAGADAQAGVRQRGLEAQSTARGLRGLVQRRGLLIVSQGDDQ